MSSMWFCRPTDLWATHHHGPGLRTHICGTVPHGTAKLWTHGSARNSKTVDSRFRTEPQNCGLTVPHGTAKLRTHGSARNGKTDAKLTQNCGLTVPHGTAKLRTHGSARNRKTVDSRLTVPHGTAKLRTHGSARNRKTVDSRFRTEQQNCRLTVPHGTAKLWTHRSARNRKTVDSRFPRIRKTFGDGGLPSTAPVTERLRRRGVTLNRAGHSTLARTGGYPQPRRSQNACEDGGLPSTAPVTERLRGRGVTLNCPGHSTLATPVAGRFGDGGLPFTRAGHSTLARMGGYHHPRRSQHASERRSQHACDDGVYPQPRRSQHACEDAALPSTSPVMQHPFVVLNRCSREATRQQLPSTGAADRSYQIL
ncbi:hypothetical protein DFH27DRAFT_645266 [Peziza echinospora]|nr:hypothetical protein DFH27DRAFT_645266 [Peziza echinospora]